MYLGLASTTPALFNP